MDDFSKIQGQKVIDPTAGGTGNDKTNTTDMTNKSYPGGGGYGKEGEAVDLRSLEQKTEMEDLGKEMEISKELAEMGVENRTTEYTVPRDLSQMGVQAVPGPSSPIIPPVQNIPLTDDKIAYGLTQKLTASVLWLANWCIKQIKKAHIKIKFVKGRLVRIATR